MQLALNTKNDLINAYKNQQASGNDPIVNAAYTPGPPVPGETPEQKAAREAAEKAAAEAAAKAAAEAAAKAAADAAKNAASKSALGAYAAAVAKGDMNAAAIAAAGVNPSALAAQESGAIGAASIAAQLKAAVVASEAAAAIAKNANTLANFKAKENAENAAAMASANAKGHVGRAKGGIIPKMFSLGGFAKGTDTVPAMLTPGEFIMSKYAVDSYGVDSMRKINNGEAFGGAVYNNTYALTVNAKTDANPNEIARAVMDTIKRVDDRRVRGVNVNGR